MKTSLKPMRPQALRLQSGFTLVEMMVALTIGIFLVGGLVSLLVSSSIARSELDKSARQIENGRFALKILSDDVRHAGFLGVYMPLGAAATMPSACETNPAQLGFSTSPLRVPVSVFGYNGSDPEPSCVADRLAGTDILVIRRVSTTATPASSPVANEVYFQSSACSDLVTPPPPFVIGTSGFTLQTKTCGADLQPLNKYMVRIYYISSCNVCSPSDNLPTLKVAEYVLGAMTVTPLVEGIQDMQLDYGIDMNGDGSPDCYISNPSDPAPAETLDDPKVCPKPAGGYDWDKAKAVEHWSNVMTIRINLLARNTETSAGEWKDTRTYDLGLAGAAGPFNDRYKRHAYSALVRLVNVAGRREKP